MSGGIQHKGIITSIEGDVVRVVVAQQSACEGCHAKGVCGEKGKERIIDVETRYADNFNVGERVIVSLVNKSMAFSSVIWGYALPLLILLVTLFSLNKLKVEDGMSAILSIVAVAVYYVGLYIFRNKIKQKIQFTIFKE